MASDSILSLLFRHGHSESQDEENVYPGVLPATRASEQPVAVQFQEDLLYPDEDQAANDKLVSF